MYRFPSFRNSPANERARSRRSIPVLILIACSLASCRSQGGAQDSYGALQSIQLVRDLVIGSAEGDDPYLFASIPGIAIGDDGRMALVDSQDPRIRVFESDGTFSHYIGGGGNGPGEFQRVISITSVSDKIVAADQMRQRFIAYSWNGEYLYDKPFPSTAFHPYRTATLGDQFMVAATTKEAADDGTVIEEYDSRYLRLFDSESEQVKRFGAMSDIIDTSSDFEARSARFTSVVFSANDERVLVAPVTWGCTAALYELQQTDPQPQLVNSPQCPDKGYRSITEAEYESYRALYPDQVDKVPGSLGASFGPDGRFYSLSWRHVDGVVQRDDGSMLILLMKWDDGWEYFAEHFSADGSYLGTANIETEMDTRRSFFAGVDKLGNFYYRDMLEDGTPVLVRYRVEYDLSKS